MMERRLGMYLWWKSRLNASCEEGGREKPTGNSQGSKDGQGASQANGKEDDGISEALKKKDAMRKEKTMSRRRTRGGAPGSSTGRPQIPDVVSSAAQESSLSAKEREKLGILTGEGEMRVEADSIAEL